MNRVLLIDDDEQLGPPLAMYFKRFDLVLEQAFTPSKGLARLQEGNFDAAILDIMLPEMDGFEVCRRIRKGSQVPIIMLTARGELTDRVVGLEMGADDYLPKPFEPRELVARVQTVLRRFRAASSGGGADSAGVHPEDASVLRFEGLVIDPVRRSVRGSYCGSAHRGLSQTASLRGDYRSPAHRLLPPRHRDLPAHWRHVWSARIPHVRPSP